MQNKTAKEIVREHLQAAQAALARGDTQEALDHAQRAYRACPEEYPANYNSLSTVLECLNKLGLKEEAKTIQGIIRKILWEHDTKPHAEGEAREKHPLKRDRRP